MIRYLFLDLLLDLLLGAILLLTGSLRAQQVAFVKIPFAATGGAMIEDDEGALWIGAEEGLYRFDGTRFRQIDLGLGTATHAIRSLARSQDGSIWATSTGGLFRVRLEGTVARVVKERPGFGIGVAIHGEYVAHVEGGGAGGNLAIGRYRDGRLSMVRYDGIYFNGPPRFAADGSLSGACGNAFCEIAATAIEPATQGVMPPMQRWPLPTNGRMSTLKDGADCRWFRNMLRSGYRCPADRQFKLLPLDQAEYSEFNSLTLGPVNRVWIFSDRGLLTYGRPGDFRTLTAQHGVPQVIQCVYYARDGSIWMTSLGALWRMIPPERLEVWSAANGVNLTGQALRRGPDGALLLGGVNGLLRLSEDRSRWEAFGDQKEMRLVRDLTPTPLGSTLVSSAYTGVMQLDLRGRILRGTQPGVTSFGPAMGNRMWTAGGPAFQMLQFGPAGLRLLSSPADLAIAQGREIARDQWGRTWLCQPEGLSRLDLNQATWRHWTAKQGLLANFCRSIAVSPSGERVWMLSTDGLSQLDFSEQGGPRTLHFRNDADEKYDFFVRYDSQGRLWRGGKGLHVADGQHAEPGQWITLNEADGFPNTQNETERTFLADTDHSIWFTCPQMVHHYRLPSDAFTGKPVPSVFLSNVPPAELRASQPAKSHFGSLYFAMRNQLRFRYRLKPEAPWTTTRGSSASFASLPAADYRFELAARVLPAGDWTPAPAVAYSFRVVAPFWQTPAAVGLAGGVSLSAVALLWGRTRRKRATYLR